MNPDLGIRAEGLRREFKDGLVAVAGIDFEVQPGEIYGFLGPNGAGKTTTVKMLTTLLPPTSGRAEVAGFDVVTQGPQVRRLAGVALQEVALDPMLTAREHLHLQGGLFGLRRSEREKRADELLDRVGLTEAADRRTINYSGGMRRRLDLALALVHRPRVLFLDEPTTGLDPQSRVGLWDEVLRLSSQDGVTVFLTTQYLEEADAMASRVGIIDRGFLVAEGTPAALKAEIGRPHVEVRLRDRSDTNAVGDVLTRFGDRMESAAGTIAVRLHSADTRVTDVVRALDEAAIEVDDLQFRSVTLDDVFLDKTGRSLEGAATTTEVEQPVERSKRKRRRR